MVQAPVQILGAATANKQNFLILADGYQDTPDGRALFEAHCSNVVAAIEQSAWYVLAPKVGVWRLDTMLPAAGTQPIGWPAQCGSAPANLPPTQFEVTFAKNGGPCRQLGGSGTKVLAIRTALQAAGSPVFDRVMTLINTTEYGAFSDGMVTWSCVKGSIYPKVLLHEMGHSFGLNDEYESKCGVADAQTVVDLTKDFNIGSDATNLPWASSVTVKKSDDTSCHSYTSAADPAIGAFQGGNHRHLDYFRPGKRCRMRNSRSEFCELCTKIIANKLDPYGVPYPLTM